MKKSQILITVIIVLFFSFALGAVLVFNSLSQREITASQELIDKAYSLARSGLRAGKKLWLNTSCNCNITKTYNLGEGTADVTVNTTLNVTNPNPAETVYTITGAIDSTGSIDGKNQSIVSEGIDEVVREWLEVYGVGQVFQLNFFSPTGDGGYIIGGVTTPSPFYFILIRIDSQKNILWAKRYDGIGNTHLYPSFLLTRNSTTGKPEYLIAAAMDGNAYPHGQGEDSILMRIDDNGSVIWGKMYSSNSQYERANFIIPTASGGFMIVGETGANAGSFKGFAIEVDSNGDVIWGKIYNGLPTYPILSFDYAVQLADNTYAFAGRINNANPFIIKLNDLNSVSWAKYYQGLSVYRLRYFLKTDDGYLLACQENPNARFLVYKTEIDGALDQASGWGWARRYNASSSIIFKQILATVDGGYLLLGASSAFSPTGQDILLAKISSSGNLIWQRDYELKNSFVTSEYDFPGYITNNDSGGYLLGAWHGSTSQSKLSVFSVDESGHMGCCDIEKSSNLVQQYVDAWMLDLSSALSVSDIVWTTANSPFADGVWAESNDFLVSLTETNINASVSHDLVCPK